MSDNLKYLLDKIDREGVQKGEEAAQKIIEAAKVKARDIISKSEAVAAELRQTAEADITTMKEKSEQALRQAARLVLLDLRRQMEKRVSTAVGRLLSSKMDCVSITPVIALLCQNYLRQAKNNSSVEVLVSPEQLSQMETSVKALLAEDFRSQMHFAPSKSLSAGFQLVFNGENVIYDFGDKALAEALAAHLSPSLTSIITDGE